MAWKKGNRLPVVTEAQATGRTREIYSELKEALGLPYVNVVFQVFGGYPQFLEVQWRAFKPIVSTARFFELAERLRADAYTRMHNYIDIPDFCAQMTDLHFSEGARNELTDVVDMFQYNNPLLLLLMAAQMQAFEGPVGDPNAPREPVEHPVFDKRPVTVDEDTAPAPTKKIYEDMKRTFEMPVVNSDYRAFARWPDFLRVYWDTLKITFESPLYHQCQSGIRETAWALTRELPGPVEIPVQNLEDAGVDESDISSIVRITDLFVHGLSALSLAVAMAKIGLEGGNMALRRKPEDAKAQTADKPADANEPTRAA